MALRKWGAVRANSQLCKADDELVRLFFDSAPDPAFETVDLGADGALYGSLVRGYGVSAGDYTIHWPGISGGFLTINDAAASHRFLVTSGVLILDDGAAEADAIIMNTNDVLLANP